MILSDIRSYLADKGEATLADVALHFDITPDAARGMLEVWMRKGKVSRRMISASCGSNCNQCDPAATEIYVWGGNSAAADLNPSGIKCSF